MLFSQTTNGTSPEVFFQQQKAGVYSWTRIEKIDQKVLKSTWLPWEQEWLGQGGNHTRCKGDIQSLWFMCIYFEVNECTECMKFFKNGQKSHMGIGDEHK